MKRQKRSYHPPLPCPLLSLAPGWDPGKEPTPALLCSPVSFLSPHSWNASSCHCPCPHLHELQFLLQVLASASPPERETALLDCGSHSRPKPGALPQLPECSLLPAAIRDTAPGIQQVINTVLEKQSTLIVLVRLFLSRGYNRSTTGLVPTWDWVGGEEVGRGTQMAELSAEVAPTGVH